MRHVVLLAAALALPFGGDGDADKWEPLEFPKISEHTTYELVDDGGTKVMKADSTASASGLIRRVDVDLKQFPVLRWRWKVDNVLKAGDVTRKDGDDYPARIYLTFAYDKKSVKQLKTGKKLKYKTARALYGDLPLYAINYIWGSKAKAGRIVDSPYTKDFVKMIVVESGDEKCGTWVTEERNVYLDFKKAFGGDEPPKVNGVAIMTDTDNTGESATAFYADIEFLPATSE